VSHPVKEKKTRPLLVTVVSDKMTKSRVGVLERRVKHPVVGKYIKRSTRIMFHDESEISRMGDEVLVVQGRPLSARKSFVLKEVVRKA